MGEREQLLFSNLKSCNQEKERKEVGSREKLQNSRHEHCFFLPPVFEKFKFKKQKVKTSLPVKAAISQ